MDPSPVDGIEKEATPPAYLKKHRAISEESRQRAAIKGHVRRGNQKLLWAGRMDLLPGDTTPGDMRTLMGVFGGECAYCACELERTGQGQKSLTWDHVVPLAKGLALTWDNTVPACRSCNSSKSVHDVDKWMRAKKHDRARFHDLWTRAKIAMELAWPKGQERPKRPAKDYRLVRVKVKRRNQHSKTCKYGCLESVEKYGLCYRHYLALKNAWRAMAPFGRVPKLVNLEAKPSPPPKPIRVVKTLAELRKTGHENRKARMKSDPVYHAAFRARRNAYRKARKS